MGSAVLTNAVAVGVSQSSPATNYDSSLGINLRTSSGADLIGYLYFARPFPLGATILSAKIKFYTLAMGSGTHTITFQRLNQTLTASKVTYNTRPTSLISGTKPVVKSGTLAAGQEWEVDITDWLQTVASGGAWYGLQITSSESTARVIYSEIHPLTQYRPRLEVTWSETPATPTGLSPSGGRAVGLSKPTVRATYVDVSAATALQAVQVQLNATDVWTGPSFDSGAKTSSVPELDLTGTFPRTTTITTTSGSATITGAGAGYEQADVGATISGTGIPGGATITAVASSTSATISANATATGSPTATITRSYAGLSDGSTVFWRIRLQNADGQWSPWSASTSFKRDDKGTLTVSNPPSGTPVVEDATPPINWSLSGETQAAYQVAITHVVNGVVVTDWDSGKTTGTATSVTVPAGKITQTGVTYTVTVRVWDTDQREATPGDPTYVEVVRDFTFVPGATTGTTSLTAIPQDPKPVVRLFWNRATAPDRFNVVRDGRVIAAALDPNDLFVSGTQYTWTDNAPPPQRSLTYSVQAVVNNVASTTNASATTTAKPSGIWLRDPTSDLELCIMGNADRDFTLGEQGAVLQSIAPDANKVVIGQSLGGLEGRIEGELHSIYGKTAQEWRDIYLRLRALRVKKLYVTVGDYAFQAVCQNFSYGQRGIPGAVFKVGFDVYQADELTSIYLGS